jgi:preprotein translocase subunit SecE
MADDHSSKPSDNASEAEASTKRQRRVLRPAPEPTTLREQSEKAQAKSSQPGKRSRVGRILAVPFRFIGRLLRPLGKFRLFRVIGYVLVPPFVRSAWRELLLVTWPDARQTRRLTFAVIIFSLIFGSIAALLDTGLDKLFRALILK